MAESSCFDSSRQEKVQPEVVMPYCCLSFSLLPDRYLIRVAPILFLLSTSPAVFPNVSNPANSYQY